MRSDDERANNLIARLFSYSPRPDRQPLEDYCTEALAWCLRNEPRLTTEMFADSHLQPLIRRSGPIQVHTQVAYTRNEYNDADEDLGDGRFDLVIEGGVNNPWVVVIESKVDALFGRDQLEKYRARLSDTDAFNHVLEDSRFLVTLTTLSHESSLIDCSITWPMIHRLVSRGSNTGNAVVAAVLKQFADFLKEKGLSMLELRKTDNDLLARWFEVKELETQMRRIVERLRNQTEVKGIVGRRQVKQDDENWIGVYGTNEFWAGFGILKPTRISEIVLWVEITIPSNKISLVSTLNSQLKAGFDAAKRYLKRYPEDHSVNLGTRKDNMSRFVFVKQLSGDINGDGEAAFRWLNSTAKGAIRLAQQSSKKKSR